MSGFKTHSEATGAGPGEIPCPDCGEQVRKELVRCWRCGGFLRQEIADSYERMRQNAPPTSAPVLREIPSGKGSQSPPQASLPSMPLADDDDDFALGPGVASIAPGQVSTPAVASDDSYQLSPSAALPELPEVPGAEVAKDSAAPTTGASKPSAAAVPTGEAHSVSSAGDVLLDIARQEEQESESRRKTRGKRKSAGPGGARSGFLIFCPYGHQIEVQEKHRGQVGKCPRCKAAFIVPQVQLEEKTADASPSATTVVTAPAEHAAALAAGKFARWMKDVRVHSLDPTKLKLKPGSMENAFETHDLGFGFDGLLIVMLTKKGSMFSSAEKKKPEIRDAMVAHLTAAKPLAELQVANQRLFGPDMIKQIQVVQPVVYAHESMFAGIPVFGINRIAVRLPKPAEGNELLFASFGLSDFREFAKQMDEVFEVEGLGEDVGVPVSDKLSDFKCHYTDTTFQALDNVDYHKADPNTKLVIVGRKCEGCGLVVSEDGRKKEKLGGVDGKGIAKAKCPKCQKKFGSITLFIAESATASAEAPAPAAPVEA